MPDSKTAHNSPAEKRGNSRRDFLRLVPFGIFTGIAGWVAAAAFRFLRPTATAAAASARWMNVAPLSQIGGDKPVMRTINVEHTAGWSSTIEERFVYVLPKQNNRVLSSACPHEGCNVTWREDTNRFFCPCHDSSFAPDGARLGGPARRGLDPLPSREKEGVLQVQYQSFVNNIEERVVLE